MVPRSDLWKENRSRTHKSHLCTRTSLVLSGANTPPPPSPIICTRVKPNGLYYVDIKIYIGDDARRGCCIRYPHTVVVVRGKYAPPPSWVREIKLLKQAFNGLCYVDIEIYIMEMMSAPQFVKYFNAVCKKMTRNSRNMANSYFCDLFNMPVFN